jgi:hypothetical protein
MPEYNVAEWVRLNCEEGRNFAEIARMFNVTRDVVKNQVHRYKEAPTDEGVSSSLPVVEVMDPHNLPDGFWDDLYDNAKEQARLRLQVEKEETVYHVRVAERAPIMFVNTADWHLLDGGTDHDLFDEDHALWRTTPGVYVGLGGDYANWFSPAVLPQAMPSNTLANEFTEPIIRRKITALKERIIYIIDGNHDLFPGATGWHPVGKIARDLGKAHLGPGGNVYLEFGTKEERWSDTDYMIAARHSFNFNSSVNDTNSMRQLWVQAGCPDIVCTSHLHRPTMHQPTFDGRNTVWIRNGAYKRNDHYAKKKNFVHTRPESPDQPGVILHPDSKVMIPFRNYRHGLPLLAHLRAQYATLTA